jgi:hypothetical protein
VVSYENSEDLDREGLKKVLNMIEKKPKIYLSLWVDYYFDKHKQLNPKNQSRINFEEYFQIVVNI